MGQPTESQMASSSYSFRAGDIGREFQNAVVAALDPQHRQAQVLFHNYKEGDLIHYSIK